MNVCMVVIANNHTFYDYFHKKMWFFGKYHIDRQIPPRYHALFEKVVKFEDKF